MGGVIIFTWQIIKHLNDPLIKKNQQEHNLNLSEICYILTELVITLNVRKSENQEISYF